jgi:hypothetical protein
MPYNRAGAMRALHLTGKQLGIDHDGLRDIARSIFHLSAATASLSKLTDHQLSMLLSHLKRENHAHQGRSNHKDPSEKTREDQNLAVISIPNGATDRQIWKIGQLERQLAWHNEPHRLAGFIARQCHGKNSLRDLTVTDAAKVIDGLKNLSQRATAPTTNE